MIGENTKTAVELADWLKHMRGCHEDSVAKNDIVIKHHVAQLSKWETMVRELIKSWTYDE